MSTEPWDTLMTIAPDPDKDPQETQEWLESLEAVIERAFSLHAIIL